MRDRSPQAADNVAALPRQLPVAEGVGTGAGVRLDWDGYLR